VTLVLTGAPNQAKQELKSDASGHFEFIGLPIGAYRLEASTPGFATFRADVVVGARPLEQMVALQVGSLTETVTVWGGSSPSILVDAPWHDDTSGCIPAARGGTIRQPLHIRNDRPVYPAQLLQTKVEGHVVLDARIGTDGSIREVRVVAPAHPDFDSAALEAVRQWRFSQTLLNCVPVEVSMTVHVNFVPRP
jgi:TonB family protein